MDILEALAKLNQPAPGERQYCSDGQLAIEDGIFRMLLRDLDVDEEVIADVMLEPVDNRNDWILYFRDRNDYK